MFRWTVLLATTISCLPEDSDDPGVVCEYSRICPKEPEPSGDPVDLDSCDCCATVAGDRGMFRCSDGVSFGWGPGREFQGEDDAALAMADYCHDGSLGEE